MFDLPTILKPNATNHDRALEQAIRKGKPDLSPISRLMNPHTCPPHLLPWLAWAFSVEIWDSNWSLARKRQVIASSIEVHRRKGTVGAVKRALGSLEFKAEIAEWFEYGGDPHTFRVYATSTDVFDAGFGIDSALVRQVHQVIETVKPVRSHYTLLVGEGFDAAAYIRSGSSQSRREPTGTTPTARPNTASNDLFLRTGARPISLDREAPFPHVRGNARAIDARIRTGARPYLKDGTLMDAQVRPDVPRLSETAMRSGVRLALSEGHSMDATPRGNTRASQLVTRCGTRLASVEVQSFDAAPRPDATQVVFPIRTDIRLRRLDTQSYEVARQ